MHERFDISLAFRALTHGDLAAAAVMALLLSWISISDIRQFRVPDAASLPLIVIGLWCSYALGHTHLRDALWGVLAGYAVFAGIGSVFFRLTGTDGLGLGDAKLLAAAGAWLGWRDLPLLVALAALTALVFALLTRNRKIAFGPWLATGLWLFWIVRLSA